MTRVLAIVMLCCTSPLAAEARRPNIVLIISDDHAWTDYGFMGHPHVATPTIDKLSRQGLTFTRGYVPSSLCCPSLASLITGRYPHQHKITSNDPPIPARMAAREFPRSDAFRRGRERMNEHLEALETLPRLLVKNGYGALQTGKWWQGHYSRGGFTHGMTQGGRHGDDGLEIGRKTMQPIYDFIAEARRAKKPFFVWYAPMMPHAPHTPPAALLEKYLAVQPNPHVARYWAMIQWFDQTCGELLSHFDEQGLAEETIVAYVADNGWIQSTDGPRYAAKSKQSPYDGGLRTPIMVRYPPKLKPQTSDTPVMSLDLFPTLLNLAGINVPEGVAGVDLVDAEQLKARRAIHGEIFTHNSQDLDHPIASLRWRWILQGGMKLLVPTAMEKDGEVELYDIVNDPYETRNLVDAKPELVKDLTAALDAWWPIGQAAEPAVKPRDDADLSRPNVLLIVADDMGYSDLGCYGGEIETANLDKLARNGLRFTQFYNTARCWPTRAALLTGYYAQQVRRDTVPGLKSGGQGVRPRWARLLPEMLKPLGYRSYHSGKWHIDGTPLEGGFDRSYRLEDHDRHFSPRRHREDDKLLPPVDPKAGYYSSTAIADYAIKFLRDHAEKHGNRPFFEFVAFTAPHFPLHAPAEDVARYRKKYLAGWDAMREDRWQRMKQWKLGGAALSEIERDVGPPYAFPEAIKKLGPNEVNRPLPWSELSAAQREFQANKMAVHAAMVDRMDREIGRIMDQLRAMRALDSTLVLFLSDNGASAEIMVRGDGHDPHAECGTGATFLSIGPGWSSLCNTPFRRHKTWVHEGGICTPLVVHWPRGFAGRGELRHTQSHVIDVVPTILEAAGSKQLEASDDAPAPPGKSLIRVLAKDGAIERGSLWWLHEGNRALRVGDWKIVAAGKDSPWELYDLGTDRAETRNLAKDQPEKLRDLADRWTRQYGEYAAQAAIGSVPTGGDRAQ